MTAPPVHPFEVNDAYTHCGLSKYYPYETLRGTLDAAGVTRVTIVQHMGEYDNSYLAGVIRDNPDTVAGVCLVNHRDPRARDQLEQIAVEGDFKGVRLTSEMIFERPELLMAAAHLGLIIQAMPHHAPADWVPYLEAAITRYPGTRVMLSHLATPRLQDAPDFAPQQPVWELARHEGVWFQVSFPSRYAPYPHEPVYPVIAQAFEAFGPATHRLGLELPGLRRPRRVRSRPQPAARRQAAGPRRRDRGDRGREHAPLLVRLGLSPAAPTARCSRRPRAAPRP